MEDQYTYSQFTNPANWFIVKTNTTQNEHIYKEYTILVGLGHIQLNHLSDEDSWVRYPSFRHAMQAAFKHADSLGPLINGER